MAHTKYSPEFKAKLVLEVISGEKELGEIASDNNINPNMLRNWKSEFVSKASTVFECGSKETKKAHRKEVALEKKNDRMLKTIGQLTLERDYLQGCFRKQGIPVPVLGEQGE